MPHMQLIYASQPFGFDAATLNHILFSARHRNKQDDVTGSLICRSDLYLQLLEGPRDRVSATFERIERDGRHLDVVVLCQGDVDSRLFGRWEMRHDPVRPWMWSVDDVRAGAVRQASPESVRAIFQRLSAEPYEETILHGS